MPITREKQLLVVDAKAVVLVCLIGTQWCDLLAHSYQPS